MWDRQNIRFRGSLLILCDICFLWECHLFHWWSYNWACWSFKGWGNGFVIPWVPLWQMKVSVTSLPFFSTELCWPISRDKMSTVWWGQCGIHDVSVSSRFLLTAKKGDGVSEISSQEFFCTRIAGKRDTDIALQEDLQFRLYLCTCGYWQRNWMLDLWTSFYGSQNVAAWRPDSQPSAQHTAWSREPCGSDTQCGSDKHLKPNN